MLFQPRLAVLLVLLSGSSLLAQFSPSGLAQRSIFRLTAGHGEDMSVGTGFCIPGRSSYILTAAHALGDELTVTSLDGLAHPVKAIMVQDEPHDVAVILLEDRPCEFSPVTFAPSSGPNGETLWLVGFGGGYDKPVYTFGHMSSDPGFYPYRPEDRAAQLNALFGHSGGPVFNSANQIVGMLGGSIQSRDYIDVIVPVEVLRKVIR